MIRNGQFLNLFEVLRYEQFLREKEEEHAEAVIMGLGSVLILAAFAMLIAAGFVHWLS